MIKTLLIGLAIFIVILLVVFLIRKIFVGVVVLILLSLGIFFGLNYYNLNVTELADVVDIYEKASEVKSNVKYNKEEKRFEIVGKEFNLLISKDDETGEYLVEGEAPAVSEEGVNSMISLLNMANKTLQIDKAWDEVKNLNKDGSNAGEVVNDSLLHMGSGLEGFIANPEEFKKVTEQLGSSGEVLVLGNLELKVVDDKLKINKILTKEQEK